MTDRYQEVIQANIAVHSKAAASYATSEPHFRPENIAIVESRLKACVDATNAKSILDLGCGTGFMIAIAKKMVGRVVGVDVTRAMLDQVDTSGPAKVELHEHDTGSFEPEPGGFDVVTAYSFIHHLYDIEPTLKTAAKALKPGGQFYCDLEPNAYFWDAITKLDPKGNYDKLVAREIEALAHNDEEIAQKYGFADKVVEDAEYGKTATGGFKEETLREQLARAGFSKVDIRYYWYLGQAVVVNEEGLPTDVRRANALRFHDVLQRTLPLSRNLFKYVGFVATK
jgi:ubiquinone/menaquinone biosynthesis C-methylase UbiE